MVNITAEDFKDWQDNPVTKHFMSYVTQKRDDCDALVHKSLEVYDTKQAALENAGMTQLDFILSEVPEEILRNLEGVKSEST